MLCAMRKSDIVGPRSDSEVKGCPELEEKVQESILRQKHEWDKVHVQNRNNLLGLIKMASNEQLGLCSSM